jgi:uncharacterized protein (TIGR02453 family)
MKAFSDSRSFFALLAANNSRQWMLGAKAEYDELVAQPFAALLQALPKRHQPFKTFRLVRDTRFSADKSPYKLMLGAAHERPAGSVEYVHVDAQGVLAAVGHYVMTPAQLSAFRVALQAEQSGAAFETLVHKLNNAGVVVDPGGATPLRSAPRGINPLHPRIQWLRWKGCVAMQRWPHSAGRADAQQIAQFFATAEPLLTWLDRWVP